MLLIVMRHGQSEADVLNVLEGRADFELTLIGKTGGRNCKRALPPVSHQQNLLLHS